MVIDLVLLAVGIALLVGGAEALVRGSAALALGLGISPLVIGLTMVSFGTSAPELVVNVIASAQGNTDVSFGIIVGSNIANIGLIIGLAAVIRPLQIHQSLVVREIPMMLLATVVVIVMALGGWLDATADVLERSDGIVLLLLFGVFLYYTVAEVLRNRQKGKDAFVDEAEGLAPSGGRPAVLRNLLLSGAGMAALLGGAQLTVGAAIDLAADLGVPEVVVAVSLVALGTSLPELVTTLVAAWRKQTDLAVGNVVGSNIFNLLFILGTSAVIRPIPVAAGGHLDLLVVGAISALLLPLSLTGQQRIIRREGALLLVIYLSYVGWRVVGAALAGG